MSKRDFGEFMSDWGMGLGSLAILILLFGTPVYAIVIILLGVTGVLTSADHQP